MTPPAQPSTSKRGLQWTPAVQKRVKQMLGRGFTHRRIAAALGISRDAVRTGVMRHNLTDVIDRAVTMRELVEDLGFRTTRGVTCHLLDQGVPLMKRNGKWTVDHATAAALRDRAARKPVVSTMPLGYVTTQQLADRWGMTAAGVRKRLKDVPCMFYRPKWGGPMLIYDLRNVERLAPPVGQAAPPRGYVSSSDFAHVVGLDRCIPTRWARMGCPHIKLRSGAVCLRPADVAVWLRGQHPHRRIYADRVAVQFAQQEAA